MALLKELKQLSELSIVASKIDEISLLANLKKLTKLELADNKISNIAPIKELKQLTEISFDYNRIRDLSPLKELKNLTGLRLDSNGISDISLLKELRQLSSLSLAYNEISDVGPLKELKNLTKLNLGYNKISNINPLKELRQLSNLHLVCNKISELPSWITNFNISRTSTTITYPIMSLEENPIQSPPPEVIQQGKEALQIYFYKREYIARLPSSNPNYPWPNIGNLTLKYKYNFFLPKDFFSKVILATKEYAVNDKLIWKHGIVIARKGAGAEITEGDDARTIQIKVAGKNRREFIRVIVKIIDNLNIEHGDLKARKVIL